MKNPMNPHRILSLALALFLVQGGPARALDVNLTDTRPYLDIQVEGKTVRIQRNQDKDHVLSGFYAKTSRPCPPFCIHPMHVARGVETVGEVAVFDFMDGPLKRGQGLLVDARTPDWYRRATIPGSVNIPWTLLSKADPGDKAFLKVLETMGVTERDGGGLLDSLKGLFGAEVDTGQWDFSDAKELLLFCNGPWCDQSPRAIKGLIGIGYPPDRLKYYRGGMNLWELFGLTTVEGK